MGLGERLQHAWNAFTGRDPTVMYNRQGYGSSMRPDRFRFTRGNERSIVNAIYNRFSLDAAAISIEHARLDENNRYLEPINSGIHDCLALSANVDQTGRAFMHDAILSMFEEGSVALVPTDATLDPRLSNSFDILSIRAAKIVEWYPDRIRCDVYNEKTGRHQEITVPKKSTAIVENPFYAVMNEPNSILQRLIRKLNLLDVVDEYSSSGKLDLIIQLPYVVKSQTRKDQAERRRQEIEEQLTGSKYGIAYTDGTERITQLNRSLENALLPEINRLQEMLYSQLGISEAVLNGTANEQEMLNYNNRIIEPILSAFADEMKRKFLTKTARSQRQSFVYFRDPFRLVPVNQLADIADKFTRNEILSSNEVRQIISFKPSKDPKADELRNKNLNEQSDEATPPAMASGAEGEVPGQAADPKADYRAIGLGEQILNDILGGNQNG